MELLSCAELVQRLRDNPDLLLLDVRDEDEWQGGHIAGAVLMPMHALPERLAELDPARETIVICQWGERSASVAGFLESQAGFARIAGLAGGMSEWSGPIETGSGHPSS